LCIGQCSILTVYRLSYRSREIRSYTFISNQGSCNSFIVKAYKYKYKYKKAKAAVNLTKGI